MHAHDRRSTTILSTIHNMSATCFGQYYFWPSSGWIQLWENPEAYQKLRMEVRKYGSPFYCHQITSHSEMPLYSLKVQSLATRWKNFHSSSSAIFVDDAVSQWVLYCVCGHKKNDGTMGVGNS